MSTPETSPRRRQVFLDEAAYRSTVQLLRQDRDERLAANPGLALGSAELQNNCFLIAREEWEVFQLRHTAGDDLTALACDLAGVVKAMQNYRAAHDASPAGQRVPAFTLEDSIDDYVDFVNLLSAAVCLHREDLIPAIHGLLEDGPYDGRDLVIEELLLRYLPDRPDIDEWCYDKPYRLLLEAVYADTPALRARGMKKYVKAWYPAMKGRARFWGMHEKIKPTISPYFGYWTMCAAAFSYLFEIDDSDYRDELVYPRDLADYARAHPRRGSAEAARLASTELRRCEAGLPCPAAGLWFTPASAQAPRHFAQGETMLAIAGDWGSTVWYWVREQPAG